MSQYANSISTPYLADQTPVSDLNSGFGLRIIQIRFAPSWANSSAIALPIPLLQPVIKAVLPCNLFISQVLSFLDK